MIDMEKVLTWLEICGENDDCSGCCPYGDGGETFDCRSKLMADALALLKEQDSVEYALDVLRRNGWKDDSYGDLLKEQETANLYKCPNCGTWVSAENVVRCKDCTYLNADTGICIVGIPHGYKDTFYCAYGKKR